MSHKRVIFKRVVSVDGGAIAEASSQAITSNDSGHTVIQSVTVHASASSGSSCFSSSSAQSSATQKPSDD